MSHKLGTLREFETKHFKVIVDALEEDDLDLSFDEDGSVLKGIQSGKFIAFVARARVVNKVNGDVLATDYLRGCIYESLDAFMDHKECGKQNQEDAARGEEGRCGSYFAQMIKEVCREARKAIIAYQGMKVRVMA